MAITLYHNDIPAALSWGKAVAVDTETLGLKPRRDRLCLVQLSSGDGHAHLVQFDGKDYSAPNLKKLLSSEAVEKLFHFARFDIAVLKHYLGVGCTPLYCTRTASKIARTYTDKHGLRELCRELLDIDLNKTCQSSDWGAATLSEDQKDYAAHDVLHLHQIRDRLDEMLVREGRQHLARACFDFLPARADLDLMGWAHMDVFEH